MKNIIKMRKAEPAHLIEVLNKLMQESNVNINQLSRNTGLSNTTIKRMCIDPDCNPTLLSVTKIAEFFGITPNQLIGLDGTAPKVAGYYPNFEAWVNIPILDLKQTIDWPNNIEEILGSQNTNYVKTDIDPKECLFATIIRDESLEPKFSVGTILIFDPTKEVRNKDYVLLLTKNKELPQFRQALIDGSDIYARTINQNLTEGSPTLINQVNNRIIGTLIQAKANFFG